MSTLADQCLSKKLQRPAHLVPEDSEPLLEGELEPVTAGDSVTSPVVEVLVPHHAFYTREVHVCCSLGRS